MDKEELDQLPSHPDHGQPSQWRHLRVDGAVARPLTLTAADLAGLRKAGWSDPQIAEAVYVTALFAFFNRVADAFGLKSSSHRELQIPPARFRPGSDE